MTRLLVRWAPMVRPASSVVDLKSRRSCLLLGFALFVNQCLIVSRSAASDGKNKSC